MTKFKKLNLLKILNLTESLFTLSRIFEAFELCQIFDIFGT